jgi:hypothetical protein
MMKRIKLIVLLYMGSIVACKTDRIRSFAPGIFVNHSKGTLSMASDTLVISVEEGHNFKSQRRTGFRLIRGGKTGKKQFEREQ